MNNCAKQTYRKLTRIHRLHTEQAKLQQRKQATVTQDCFTKPFLALIIILCKANPCSGDLLLWFLVAQNATNGCLNQALTALNITWCHNVNISS